MLPVWGFLSALISTNKKGFTLNYFNSFWKLFVSVKLTVVLLLSLAGTSIIGTVIPQNEQPAAYLEAYGEFLYRILYTLDIFDMYHSWWFQLLILLLTMNVIVCSADRLSNTWKIVFVKNPQFNVDSFKRRSDKIEFLGQHPLEDLRKRYLAVVAKYFGYRKIEDTNQGFCILAEKWRWTRLGVYTVHLSIVLLLVGGLVGSIFGFDGHVNIPEGKSVNSIRMRNNMQPKSLDFEILCEDFNVSFYDSGAPKEYRSRLTILEQGQAVLTKDIIVNDPLRYKGINIFQSSYGKIPPQKVTLNFTNRTTGKVYPKEVLIGRQIDIPEAMGKFVLTGYTDSYHFKGQHLGEAFRGILTQDNGTSTEIILPLRFAGFDNMREGHVVVSVAGYTLRYYTGLQVTKDPGVWIVYAGFLLMIIGCYITFFTSHQRLCVEVVQSGQKSKVMVSGSANKNKFSMQNKVQKIAEKLK
ncbi:cytochrome c biogenesis protein ResB [Thermodesulfobacteriota bacterium]